MFNTNNYLSTKQLFVLLMENKLNEERKKQLGIFWSVGLLLSFCISKHNLYCSRVSFYSIQIQIQGGRHSFMVPANSWLWSSSRNIKDFQRDWRFSHSKTVLFTVPPKSILLKKRKKEKSIG